MKIIEWKPIKDFEGIYEVSNDGRVRSLNHKRKNKNGFYIQKGKILKCGINTKTGYKMISLSKDGISKTKYIHKLVAETFLDNPNNYECINHKDENELNNNIDNLEFCTQKYNCRYGNRNKKIAEKLSKKINQYDLEGNFIKTWDSSVQIEKTININQGNISMCILGKRKTAGGFIWKYKEVM